METRVKVKTQISRWDFPDDFVFGAATSAYQVEGAARTNGRGPSIWDIFAMEGPDRVKGRASGDHAANSYNLYKEDVKLLKKIGFDAYRFSISWSRILPFGRREAGVNWEGVMYYSNLIDELLRNGIQPFVTLLHFDVPQALEEEYKGFLNRKIVNDYAEYAELCFYLYGNRVKHWITINEPFTFAVLGYDSGQLAPGRGSSSEIHAVEANAIHNKCFLLTPRICKEGDPATEPYTVAHHQLLAHAKVALLYKKKYQPVQKGKIGISLVSPWVEPRNGNNPSDREAQNRALAFRLGWFMEPLTRGKYPEIMQESVGDRLPKFTEEESRELKKSCDFIGLNYYTTSYAKKRENNNINKQLSYSTDGEYEISHETKEGSIGPQAGSSWLYVYPEGIYKLLVHIKKNYKDPLIYITENGYDDINKVADTLTKACLDNRRIKFHKDHLANVCKAIYEGGVKVEGYFVWSLLDNFEWNAGYAVRFGIVYVDFEDFTRVFKNSAIWFSSFLNKDRDQLEDELIYDMFCWLAENL